MVFNLPEQWTETSLGKVVRIEMGQSPKGTATNLEGHGIQLVGGAADLGEETPISERFTTAPTKVCEPNDIILCIRATIGKHNTADKKYCLGRGVAGLRPRGVQQGWLKNWLTHNSNNFEKLGTGTTFKQINKAVLNSFPIQIPPLQEQKRIANKIEALQAKSKKAKKALETAKPLLVKLRQSILASAFRGDLTADWRKKNPDVEPASVLLERIRVERRKKWEENELAKMKANGKEPKDDKWKSKYKETEPIDTKDLPELPESWCWARLEEISVLKGGLTKGKKRKETDVLKSIPYLRVANVQRGYLDLEELSLIEATEIEVQELKLQYDDILFNEGGDRDKLGRGWIWKDDVEECIHQNHVFRARLVSNEMISELISYFGNTFGQQWFMKEGKQSTNLASLNLTKLSNFPIPIIPYAEAKRIFKIINIHFERLESLQKLTSSSFKKMDVLDQSILNNAFQGRLVSQDPSDEPAMILLRQIQNEKNDEMDQ